MGDGRFELFKKKSSMCDEQMHKKQQNTHSITHFSQFLASVNILKYIYDIRF